MAILGSPDSLIEVRLYKLPFHRNGPKTYLEEYTSRTQPHQPLSNTCVSFLVPEACEYGIVVIFKAGYCCGELDGGFGLRVKDMATGSVIFNGHITVDAYVGPLEEDEIWFIPSLPDGVVNGVMRKKVKLRFKGLTPDEDLHQETDVMGIEPKNIGIEVTLKRRSVQEMIQLSDDEYAAKMQAYHDERNAKIDTITTATKIDHKSYNKLGITHTTSLVGGEVQKFIKPPSKEKAVARLNHERHFQFLLRRVDIGNNFIKSYSTASLPLIKVTSPTASVGPPTDRRLTDLRARQRHDSPGLAFRAKTPVATTAAREVIDLCSPPPVYTPISPPESQSQTQTQSQSDDQQTKKRPRADSISSSGSLFDPTPSTPSESSTLAGSPVASPSHISERQDQSRSKIYTQKLGQNQLQKQVQGQSHGQSKAGPSPPKKLRHDPVGDITPSKSQNRSQSQGQTPGPSPPKKARHDPAYVMTPPQSQDQTQTQDQAQTQTQPQIPTPNNTQDQEEELSPPAPAIPRYDPAYEMTSTQRQAQVQETMVQQLHLENLQIEEELAELRKAELLRKLEINRARMSAVRGVGYGGGEGNGRGSGGGDENVGEVKKEGNVARYQATIEDEDEQHLYEA